MDHQEERLLYFFRQCDSKFKDLIIETAEITLKQNNRERRNADLSSLPPRERLKVYASDFRALLREKGFTVQSLSQSTGLSELKISAIITGGDYVYEEYRKVADALRMSTSDLGYVLCLGEADVCVLRRLSRKKKRKKADNDIIEFPTIQKAEGV